VKIHNLDFRLVATAAAAIVCAGSANAALFGERFDPAKLTIVEDASGATSATYNGAAVGKLLYLSGASASSKTLGAFVIGDNCDPATLSVLWNSASGSDYRAYACDMKAGNIINAGAADSLVVIKRDKGGSTFGVGPIATPAKIDFMSLAGCVATGSTPDLNTPNYTCGNIEQRYPDAGFSDVEPSILANNVNGGSGSLAISGSLTIKPVFVQLIGVGVNTKLYRALQATQGLTQNDDPANRPTLDRTFIANAVAGKLNGGGSGKGWGLVVSKAVDADVDQKQINICRRVNGSGTQAAANIYFQQNPCSPGLTSPLGNNVPLAVKGSGTSANNTSYTSTGLVESCLGSVNGLTDATLTNKDGYAIGHVGRDNDPFAGGGDKGYRFVKINGQQPEAHPDPTTGLCSYPGCNDAQSGKYDYVFESTMQWNSSTPGNAGKSSMLSNVASLGFNATALKGNTPAVIAGVMAPASSYSGLYSALPLGSDAQVYGSRVSRLGNSCAPLTVSK
jgi:hypothetical protein